MLEWHKPAVPIPSGCQQIMTKVQEGSNQKNPIDPFNQTLRRVLLFLLIAAMLAFAALLIRARLNGTWPLFQSTRNQETPTPLSVTATIPDSPLPPAPTGTPTLPVPSATPLPTTAQTISQVPDPGTIFFSMQEAGYWHIYAYHPQNLPLTRLTSGAWDDIAPAASPDGSRLAFASNSSRRLGFIHPRSYHWRDHTDHRFTGIRRRPFLVSR